MTEEIIEQPITINERDANIRELFSTLYDILRKFSAQSQNDVENLKSLSKTLYLVIEKTAEHRARVICGEYIKLIKDDIGNAITSLKPAKNIEKPVKAYKTFPKEEISNKDE